MKEWQMARQQHLELSALVITLTICALRIIPKCNIFKNILIVLSGPTPLSWCHREHLLDTPPAGRVKLSIYQLLGLTLAWLGQELLRCRIGEAATMVASSHEISRLQTFHDSPGRSLLQVLTWSAGNSGWWEVWRGRQSSVKEQCRCLMVGSNRTEICYQTKWQKLAQLEPPFQCWWSPWKRYL